MCNFCNDDPEQCVYASTCSACGKKYFGNGYGETKLPCYECLKLQQAKSISKSQWYLVRKDRAMKPWHIYVLLLTFKTASQADLYAELYGYQNYLATRGAGIIERQTDESLGLVKLVYISAPNKACSGLAETSAKLSGLAQPANR